MCGEYGSLHLDRGRKGAPAKKIIVGLLGKNSFQNNLLQATTHKTWRYEPREKAAATRKTRAKERRKAIAL